MHHHGCKASQITTTCLLKTAIAPVVSGKIKTQANILFDEGAQHHLQWPVWMSHCYKGWCGALSCTCNLYGHYREPVACQTVEAQVFL